MAMSLLDYDPVRRALAGTRDVVVRLGPWWCRLGAWWFAMAAPNEAAQLESLLIRKHLASSGWVQLTPGADITPAGLHGEQAAAAEKWLMKVGHGEAVLNTLVRERRDGFGLPTLLITLHELPDNVVELRFDEGCSQPVTGEDRFTGTVIFPGSVHGLTDSWSDAAVEFLDGLGAPATRESGESLVDVDADDSVAPVLRLHRNTKGDG